MFARKECENTVGIAEFAHITPRKGEAAALKCLTVGYERIAEQNAPAVCKAHGKTSP